MKPILEIDNFKLAFHGPAGRVAAVRGVSLSVYPGEAVALVGESGCGKTSLVRAVLDFTVPMPSRNPGLSLWMGV